VATSSSRDDTPTPTAAVLGSARIERPDPRWNQAYELGAALGENGWVVMTGGYGGLMAAAGAGARSTGGRTVGLPMSRWEHLVPHEHNDELRWSSGYAQRLHHLLGADIAFALPGGIGTLSEASIVWAAAQTEPDAPDLILIGDAWGRIIDTIAAHLVVDHADMEVPRFAEDVAAALETAHTLLRQPRQPGRARG
jgi:uncharacterized protein (TIGR00725 family)